MFQISSPEQCYGTELCVQRIALSLPLVYWFGTANLGTASNPGYMSTKGTSCIRPRVGVVWFAAYYTCDACIDNTKLRLCAMSIMMKNTFYYTHTKKIAISFYSNELTSGDITSLI